MKKRYGIALAIVMAVPAMAMAGERITEPVMVDTHGWWANGSIGSARNSRDSKQYIGCSLWSTTAEYSGFCRAQDATGVVRACLFTNKDYLARAITTIADNSFIHFGWDEFGYCTNVLVTNNSWNETRK